MDPDTLQQIIGAMVAVLGTGGLWSYFSARKQTKQAAESAYLDAAKSLNEQYRAELTRLAEQIKSLHEEIAGLKKEVEAKESEIERLRQECFNCREELVAQGFSFKGRATRT